MPVWPRALRVRGPSRPRAFATFGAMSAVHITKRVIAAMVLLALILGGAQCAHSFVSFEARSKWGEARHTLEQLCLAQQRHLADGGLAAAHYRELGDEVPRGNRYAYFVAPGPRLEERLTNHGPSAPDPLATGVQVDVPRFVQSPVAGADLPVELAGGVRLGGNGECPKCSWVLVAAGNIDLDQDLDVWSAATSARQTATGVDIPPCQPFHERNDVSPGPLGFLFSENGGAPPRPRAGP